MMDYTVAVIIPIYNVEEYLCRCVESVLTQTYKPNEIILVDDGSTDNSPQICDQFQSDIDSITVIHQENKGLAGAKNTGIDACKSEYVVFVDSDDYIEPYLIEHLVDGMKKLKADIICEPLTFEYPNGYKKPVPKFKSLIMDTAQAQGCILKSKYSGSSSCAKLFPIDILRQARFPVGKINEDLRTTYLQIGLAKSVGFIPYSDYHYIQRRGSILYGDQNINTVLDAILVCENFQRDNESIDVKRGGAVRIYMLIAGFFKASKKVPNQAVKTLQKFCRKQKEVFYSDPDNKIIEKIKYFLISCNVLTFRIYSLLQKFQMKKEAGSF